MSSVFYIFSVLLSVPPGREMKRARGRSFPDPGAASLSGAALLRPGQNGTLREPRGGCRSLFSIKRRGPLLSP